MFFIVLLVLTLGFIGSISFLSFFKLLLWKDKHFPIDDYLDFREQTINDTQKFEKLLLLAINMVISLFFFPVFLLMAVQIKNLLINKTTY